MATLTRHTIYKNGGASYRQAGVRASVYCGPKMFSGPAPESIEFGAENLATPNTATIDKTAAIEAKAAAKAAKAEEKIKAAAAKAEEKAKAAAAKAEAKAQAIAAKAAAKAQAAKEKAEAILAKQNQPADQPTM